jgi:signal transduction histidine kinase
MRPPRASVRLWLTLVYGGLFLLAGAGLLAVNYALVRSHFSLPFDTEVQAPSPAPGEPVPAAGRTVVFLASAPGSEKLVVNVRDLADLKTVRRELETAALNQIAAQSGAALAVMALVSIGLGWLVAGRVLRPLAAITATARRLEGSTLHERLNFQGPQDELKELADTFDQMLGRLDAAFETQRRFVANASHELRTPLAIARTEVDVALADPDTGPDELRAMAGRVLEANQRSERLIEGLLTLARSERQLRAREPLDLAVAADDALAVAAPEVERLGLRVSRMLGAAPGAGGWSLPRPPPPGPCWSGWSPTWSRTPSATTAPAAGSRSTPAAPAPWPWSGSPTAAPPSPPIRSRPCSSPSAALRPTAPARTAAPASACPSSARSPPPTAAGPPPAPWRAAASR